MYASLTQFRFLTFTALRILIIATRRNRNRISKTIKYILRKLPLTVQTGCWSKQSTFLPSIAVRHRYGPFQSSNPFFSIAVNKGRNRS